MALTVVKYRKSSAGETTPSATTLIQNQRNIIKTSDGTGLLINKIPASIKPAIKRTASSQESSAIFKSPKYSLQTIASAGTPMTSLQWQPGGTTVSQAGAKSVMKKPAFGTVIGSLPPNTIIQSSSNNSSNTTRPVLTNGVTVSPISTGPVGTMQVRRPTIFLKREAPTRTMRQITLDLIEKNPKLHLGLDDKRLQLVKSIISTMSGVPLPDCYLTIRKLRQNEDIAILAELFEISEEEALKTIAQSVANLARFMRGMLRWPDSKKYYDRHKDLPFELRGTMSHVQSLIETVETEMRLQPNNLECQSYKFILSITPNGIITYVSDAYLGKYDDLAIFSASKFKDIIPKYLTLMVEPGKAVRRKRTKGNGLRFNKLQRHHEDGTTDSNTDSAEESADELDNDDRILPSAPMSNYAAQRLAGELAADQTLCVVDNELRSSKVGDLSIPTIRVPEPVCRQKIRDSIERLREYRILQDCAIREPLMFQYLNEIIIVVAALTNLVLE